jgi:tetratricopeptide (TPR) repeat protein
MLRSHRPAEPTQCESYLGRVPSSSTKSVGNLAIYEECLAIRRRLVKVDPLNTQWQHDEACLLDQIGSEYRNAGMKRQAIAAYEASLAVLRHLAQIDPRNIQRQLDVAVSLNKLGDAKLDGVDTWGAITCYEASVTIWRRLLGREPSNVCWHSNLAQIQEKIGDLKFAAGDNKGALTPYEEMLAADRELVEIDGSNIEWQWNLSSSLERMGDVRLALGNAIFAVAAYEESVAIRRHLIELDGSNTQWPEEVSCIVKKIDHAKRAHEEQLVTDDHLDDVEAPTTLLAGKERVSLSDEEVTARAKHSFFALIKATKTLWQRESLLLITLRKRTTEVVRSFRRASEVKRSQPEDLKLLSSCGKESATASSIQGQGDGVVSAIGGAFTAVTVLSSDSVPNADNAKASDQASIKRSRRRRRRKRKRPHDTYHFSPRKKAGPSISRQ